MSSRPSRSTPSILILLALLLLLPASPAPAQEAGAPAPRSRLLLLGTYHMANPGLDARNLRADDVLAPRRQREIEDLVERILSFAPTVVAIEAPFGEETWPERYGEWRAGGYDSGPDEIEQIAFRVAAKMGLETIHPVDYPLWMNGWRRDEIDWEVVAAREDAPKRDPDDPRRRRLLDSTVGEYLAWLNSPAQVQRSHAVYMEMLRPDDGPGLYARTDRVARWYSRNLRIFTNLNRIVGEGEERVLLLIGSGHLKILRDLAADSPRWDPVDPLDLLRSEEGARPRPAR